MIATELEVLKRHKDKLNLIHNKDSRTLLDHIGPDLKITSTITSPPYFDMKNYGVDDQVGYGQSYEEYLNDLQKIFGDIREITEENGTLWIIIDTFKRDSQVVTLPFDLSNKLKEVGWLLQDVIIWKKDKTVPWSVNGFMQRKFEYILFFSKNEKYKSNKDSVRVFDKSRLKKWWVKYPERYNPKGKALDEIWEFPIPTQGSWGDKYIRHFCPLPQEMVETMIQISSDENDIILDPFAGTGTVLSQSLYMKRNYIGFELNPKYIEMFQEYLSNTLEVESERYLLKKTLPDQELFEELILNLRALKFAKILVAKIDKIQPDGNWRIYVEEVGRASEDFKVIKVEYQFIGILDKDAVKEVLKKLVEVPPLSKFGIVPIFKFRKSRKILPSQYCYTKTNTHSYLEEVDINSLKIRVFSNICVKVNENDYS